MIRARRISLAVLVLSMLATPMVSASSAIEPERFDTICDNYLPSAPPAVVDGTTGSFSYLVGKSQVEYGSGVKVSLQILAPTQQTYNFEPDQNTERVTFTLDTPTLPSHTRLPYRINVELRGADTSDGTYVASLHCSTHEIPLAFVVSNLSPSDALELDPDEREEFIRAAGQAVGYNILREDSASDNTADIGRICESEFEAPTPCDWAPGETQTETGTDEIIDPQQTSGLDAAIDAQGAVDALVGGTAGCRIIRFQTGWSRYGYQTQPESEALWGGEARAYGSANHADRINLFTRISGGGFGSSSSWAAGRIGKGFTFYRPSHPNQVYDVRPRLTFAYRGTLDAEAFSTGVVSVANTNANFYTRAWSYKNADASPGNPAIVETHKSNPVFPVGSPKEIGRTVTDALPPVHVRHGDAFGAFLENYSWVSGEVFAAGSGAAISNESERQVCHFDGCVPCAEEGACRYIKASYVDLIMQNYPAQSWDPSYGGQCIGS